MAKVRIGAVIAALAIICGLVFLIVQPTADPLPLRPLPLVMVAWALFLGAAWLLRGIPLRWAGALIVIGAEAGALLTLTGQHRVQRCLGKLAMLRLLRELGVTASPQAHRRPIVRT